MQRLCQAQSETLASQGNNGSHNNASKWIRSFNANAHRRHELSISPPVQWRIWNFKVGGGRISPAQSAGNVFLVVPLHFFGSKITLSRFGERFRDGQYSLIKFLVCWSSIHGLLRAQPLVKVGGRARPRSYGVGATDPVYATILSDGIPLR